MRGSKNYLHKRLTRLNIKVLIKATVNIEIGAAFGLRVFCTARCGYKQSPASSGHRQLEMPLKLLMTRV